MRNITSLIAMASAMILVPWILHSIPYFTRPHVIARRVAKAKLSGWVSLVELFLFGVLCAGLTTVFFLIEGHAHQALHHGRPILTSIKASYSADLIFWMIEVLTPLMLALPLGMLMANVISWLIPPIRKAEHGIMEEGVPGYKWHDLNYGLIKAALVIWPLCMILDFISLVRF